MYMYFINMNTAFCFPVEESALRAREALRFGISDGHCITKAIVVLMQAVR